MRTPVPLLVMVPAFVVVPVTVPVLVAVAPASTTRLPPMVPPLVVVPVFTLNVPVTVPVLVAVPEVLVNAPVIVSFIERIPALVTSPVTAASIVLVPDDAVNERDVMLSAPVMLMSPPFEVRLRAPADVITSVMSKFVPAVSDSALVPLLMSASATAAAVICAVKASPSAAMNAVSVFARSSPVVVSPLISAVAPTDMFSTAWAGSAVRVARLTAVTRLRLIRLELSRVA